MPGTQSLPEQPLAIGFTAEVFTWKPGWVLKLFNLGISPGTVKLEARLARLVEASGLSVPKVGELLEIDGRYGLEYERVDGISMLQVIFKQPWRLVALARQLAELQAQMHQVRLPDLPPLSERLERKIRGATILPERVCQAALAALGKLPEEDYLCHGDFHPGNILLTARGPVIIDWIDASRGSPLLDIARSTLLFGGGALPPRTPGFVKLSRAWFYRIYLRHYISLNPIDRQELARWIPVVAAARLDENITFDEKWLLSLAKRLVE